MCPLTGWRAYSIKAVQKLIFCVLTECEHHRRGAQMMYCRHDSIDLPPPLYNPAPTQDFTEVFFRAFGSSVKIEKLHFTVVIPEMQSWVSLLPIGKDS